MTNCTCGRLTRDHHHVCETCLSTLTRHLNQTRWLDDELQTTIANQRAVTYDGPGGGASAEVPLPINIHAANVRTGYVKALRTAARFCIEERVRTRPGAPVTPRSWDDGPALARWLVWRVDGLALNDAAPDVIATIDRAYKTAEQAIDRRPDRAYAGPCNCGRDLYTKPGDRDAKCKGCGETWDTAELRAWMESQVRGRLVTITEGATLLGRLGFQIALKTMKDWASRGRVQHHGHNQEGTRVYLFDELLDYANSRAS